MRARGAICMCPHQTTIAAQEIKQLRKVYSDAQGASRVQQVGNIHKHAHTLCRWEWWERDRDVGRYLIRSSYLIDHAVRLCLDSLHHCIGELVKGRITGTYGVDQWPLHFC